MLNIHDNYEMLSSDLYVDEINKKIPMNCNMWLMCGRFDTL